MNIWRAVLRELAAAGRSLRYDLRRRIGWSGPPTDDIAPGAYPEYDAYTRRGRRTRTAVAVALLAAGGAVVTYAGVVGGLSALLADEAPAPGALPGVVATAGPAGPPPVRSIATGPATAGPVHHPDGPPAAGAEHPGERWPDRSTAGRPAERASAGPPALERPTPTRSAPVPTPAPEPTCGCPTATPTPTPTPSYSPSPSPSPTGSAGAAPSPAGAALAS